MKLNYKEILDVPAPSLREAVTFFFRDAILTGNLRSGDSIPSSRELAKLLNTSCPNIHHGLKPLVKEGLISRDRKAGTTVNSRERKIEGIVIYVCMNNLDDLGPFQHALTDILSNRLKNMGIVPHLIVDNESFHGLEQVREWTEKGKIQGVVMPREYYVPQIRKILKSLPVPVVFPGTKSRIKIDDKSLNDLALRSLKRQGCKSVGVISSIEHFDEKGKEGSFYIDFKEKADKYRLKYKKEWIDAVTSKENYLRSSEMAMSFAFSAAERIMNLRDRPDGLFVFSDNLIAGIMLALMKAKVNIPEELKLVLHRNFEVEIPIFTPCTLIGLSISEVADGLIDYIMTQFHGKKFNKKIIKYKAIDFNM